MTMLGKKIILLFCLISSAGFFQRVHAQRSTFFHHINWNQALYTSAGEGAHGFSLNSLYRNYNDTINYFFSTNITAEKINSTFGFYHLHNSAIDQQTFQTGLSYTAFIRFGEKSSLRLGGQGNRHQVAHSSAPLTFREYKKDTSYHTYDLSLFLKHDKLSLGFSVINILHGQPQPQTDYVVLIGFNQLRTNSWLHSTPYMLARLRPDYQIPEWRFNYTATICNFLNLGASYYKNSEYLFGINAGLKLFNRVWLTAATDFPDTFTIMPQQPIYEFGFRFNLSKPEPFQKRKFEYDSEVDGEYEM